MEHKQLPVLEIIKYGFWATWQNIGTLLKVSFSCLFIYIISFCVMAMVLFKAGAPDCFSQINSLYEANYFDAQTPESMTIIFQDIWPCIMPIAGWIALFGCIFILIHNIVSLGCIKIALNLHDSKPAPITLLLTTAAYLPAFLGAWLIYIPMTLIGFLLFIIPGIFVAIRFGFFQLFIIDQQCGPIKALKRSYNVTREYTWQLIKICLGFMFIAICLRLFNHLALMIVIGKSAFPTLLIILMQIVFHVTFYAASLFSYVSIYRQLTDSEHVHHSEY